LVNVVTPPYLPGVLIKCKESACTRPYEQPVPYNCGGGECSIPCVG
jgi:hypothetical protein